MKNITSSVYDFQDLITNNFLYVDKTQFIWELVKPGKGMYFLSRPRRFGKSLTVSTLKALFQGKKELFKGLAIYNKPYDWRSYPIIHISFGDYNAVSNPLEELPGYLHAKLQDIAEQYSLSIHRETPGLYFGALIDALAKDNQVVILIDEYDKPILDNIASPQLGQIQQLLKGFYGIIKDRNSKERFVFVTGVSKFSHVSIFSDLNNLLDLSQHRDFATMFGYTQEELEQYFADKLHDAQGKLAIPREKLLSEIKSWYDGYKFEEESESVYNPVSVAQFFLNDYKFNNYWFATGTPSFLIKLIRQRHFDFQKALSRPAAAISFDSFEVDNLDPLSLLLQTGYLTIKSCHRRFNQPWFQLDFPNREVSVSFNTYLLNSYSKSTRSDTVNFCQLLASSMIDGNTDLLRQILESFFAGISYEVHHKDESNFQNIFFAIFRLLGYYIEAESHTSDGRIDAIAQTDKWIYLFEFKLNQEGQVALKQIRDKEYFKPYLFSKKRVVIIGVAFDSNSGKIAQWKSQELKAASALPPAA